MKGAIILDFLENLMAAIGVVLNGLPQGLMAISFGFASVPTAFGFIIGAIACYAMGSVAPISFQAETIVIAGTMGKDFRERLSMVFFAGLAMAALGWAGLLTAIVEFSGEVIINAMLAGVGFMLAKIALDMVQSNKIAGTSSLITALLVYLFLGKNLVYTILASVVVATLASHLAHQDLGTANLEKMGKFKFHKPLFNLGVLRGALALMCMSIGGNIAFGSITGGIAGRAQNIDHLTIYSGLADAASSLFGGGPLEAIISATAGAPDPVLSGVLMMVIMAAILFVGLLPKIGRFVPSQSIAGFLFVLGAIVTVPTNAAIAFSGTAPGDPIIAGVTMVVTAATDPFIGMISGILLRLLAGVIGF